MKSKAKRRVKTVFKSVKPFLKIACTNVQTNRQTKNLKIIVLDSFAFIKLINNTFSHISSMYGQQPFTILLYVLY